MAAETGTTDDRLIERIRALQGELAALGVRRESFNFRRLNESQLAEIVEALENQLEMRKRFLAKSN
ncbi:MAG TPA: hypothetical protein VF599_12655 [Pyrinomonadaceae bacterium]